MYTHVAWKITVELLEGFREARVMTVPRGVRDIAYRRPTAPQQLQRVVHTAFHAILPEGYPKAHLEYPFELRLAHTRGSCEIIDAWDRIELRCEYSTHDIQRTVVTFNSRSSMGGPTIREFIQQFAQ